MFTRRNLWLNPPGEWARVYEVPENPLRLALSNGSTHLIQTKGQQAGKISGLGILLVRKRAARMVRNPMTGEAIKIKATKKSRPAPPRI